MSIRTQQYAQKAYPMVEAVQHAPGSLEANYRSVALSFPTMIMQSGLSQAIGFLMAKGKGKDEHTTLLAHLAQLLGFESGEHLHQVVVKSQLKEYQLLTRQALEASAWLKRYTQALLKKKE